MRLPEELTHKAHYTFWTQEKLRFADLDVLGHINNKSIAAFFENARVEFLASCMPLLGRTGQIFVLAQLVIDFHAELTYPGTVDIGSKVTQIGNSSCILAHGLFKGQDCVATSTGTCVYFDEIQRHSLPIPEDLKTKLLAA